MITPQEKQTITKLLDQFGPERVMKALQRKPESKDWYGCFLACVYGEKGELAEIGMQPVPLRDADTNMAKALGITLQELGKIVSIFDSATQAFIALVEEWLELNTVTPTKKESPEAVGIGV